jgi:hypothetical protein
VSAIRKPLIRKTLFVQSATFCRIRASTPEVGVELVLRFSTTRSACRKHNKERGQYAYNGNGYVCEPVQHQRRDLQQ